MNRTLMIALLLVGAAHAQSGGVRATPPSITLSGKTYDTTQPMPPEVARQVEAFKAAPPPEVVSRSVKDAARLIMNERQALSALLNKLPDDLTAALNKAPMRPSVGLPPGSTLKFPNALAFRLDRTPQSSVIATGPYMIVTDGKTVTIYKSAFSASQMHQMVKKMREIDSRR